MEVQSRTETGTNPAWDAERITLGRSFLRDMEHLWSEVLRMAGIVESALNNAIEAVCHDRTELASRVQGGEPAVNSLDVQIELDCLKILALHQPVASDLRRVAAILRIDHDLERMADLAEHISKRAKKQAREAEHVPIPVEVEQMAAESFEQVRNSLDALANADSDLARSIIIYDRQVDRLRRDLVRRLKESIRQDPDRLDSYLRLIDTARNLERIADHATNIAEAVIYMKEGHIVRHVARRAGKPGTE